MNLRYSIDPADTDGGTTAAAIEREVDDLATSSTHDWHVGTDGMELLIRSDKEGSVGVHLGHENIDDAHSTVILTSRLLEMIDTVQPGAVRAHLAEQEDVNERAERVRAWAADQYPSGTPLDQDRRMVAAETEAYLSGRPSRDLCDLIEAARNAGPVDPLPARAAGRANA